MNLNKGGGDTKTAQARQEIARREEQIVALRLRHRSFSAIGRAVGVSKQAAQKAYFKALHRNTDQDISTHHRSELAELDAEASAAWELVDTKDSPKAELDAEASAAWELVDTKDSPKARSFTASALTSYPTNAAKPNEPGGPCQSRNRSAFMMRSTPRANA